MPYAAKRTLTAAGRISHCVKADISLRQGGLLYVLVTRVIPFKQLYPPLEMWLNTRK